MPVPGKSYLNIYGRDITERKRLEDKLLHKERLAILGQLAATVSHELRDPLGVIRTSTFVVRDNLKDLRPARRALVGVDRTRRDTLRPHH